MKTILIIFTGGTISMRYDEVFSKSVMDDNHHDLINKISSRIENVKFETLVYSMVPSPSMSPADMLALGKIIKHRFSETNIDGIVITHGTDTLEETAFFLDFYLNETRPVVITGSMRNFDEVGYDGFSNLLSAILVALDEQSSNRGVLVCLNDEINAAAEVQKTHTMALDTFKSLEFGPLGLVDEKTVLYYRDSTYKRFFVQPQTLNKRVEIVKVVSGSDGNILDYYVNQNVDGIILEALGRGNVPKEMVPNIEKAIAHGISVVVTSRCPMGRVRDSYGYDGGGFHLRNIGVHSGGFLTSEKARLLLLALLSSNLNPKSYFTYDFQ